MRWCIYATFCIMLFLFSGFIKPRDLPGENFAWNHFKQQLNFSCWTITCPSFILLGKWKGNHFLCRTGALLCFSWCWIYIRSWSSMNLWLLNNNSSSVRHQQGHEREMTHRHTHIQKKLKKGKKISVGSQPQFIHCEAISLQAGFSSGLVLWHHSVAKMHGMLCLCPAPACSRPPLRRWFKCGNTCVILEVLQPRITLHTAADYLHLSAENRRARSLAEWFCVGTKSFCSKAKESRQWLWKGGMYQ